MLTNRNTQEAGAPIAFREEGVGMIDTWTGEPLESIWETEETSSCCSTPRSSRTRMVTATAT